MHRPVQLLVKKKETVPTKHQLVHQFRSDWKHKGILTYTQVAHMFKTVGNGPMETDAQFINYILKTDGPGTYMILGQTKGLKGFFNFLMFEVNSDGTYKRIKRSLSSDERAAKRAKQDYLKQKDAFKNAQDPELKAELREELDEKEADADFASEFAKSTETKRVGCSPWLKNAAPVGKLHPCEEYTTETSHGEYHSQARLA